MPGSLDNGTSTLYSDSRACHKAVSLFSASQSCFCTQGICCCGEAGESPTCDRKMCLCRVQLHWGFAGMALWAPKITPRPWICLPRVGIAHGTVVSSSGAETCVAELSISVQSLGSNRVAQPRLPPLLLHGVATATQESGLSSGHWRVTMSLSHAWKLVSATMFVAVPLSGEMGALGPLPLQEDTGGPRDAPSLGEKGLEWYQALVHSGTFRPGFSKHQAAF